MKTHLEQCETTLPEENVDILHTSASGEAFVLTLEALYQRELKPTINKKKSGGRANWRFYFKIVLLKLAILKMHEKKSFQSLKEK